MCIGSFWMVWAVTFPFELRKNVVMSGWCFILRFDPRRYPSLLVSVSDCRSAFAGSFLGSSVHFLGLPFFAMLDPIWHQLMIVAPAQIPESDYLTASTLDSSEYWNSLVYKQRKRIQTNKWQCLVPFWPVYELQIQLVQFQCFPWCSSLTFPRSCSNMSDSFLCYVCISSSCCVLIKKRPTFNIKFVWFI